MKPQMQMQLILAWYNVTDLAVATKFYTETLGLKQILSIPGRWAEFAEHEDAPAVGISQADKWEPGGTIVFRVTDIAAARAEMEKRGVEFIGGIEEIPGMVRLSTFVDPAGNRLQLAQPLAGSKR